MDAYFDEEYFPLNISTFNTSSNQSCENSDVEFNQTFAKWLNIHVINSVSSLGLVGNLVAMFMIKPSGAKTKFHQSLLALCCCDILFLAVVIIDKNVDMITEFGVIFPYLWHPLRTMLISFETFMMMSISTERFMAVNKPVHFKMSKMSRSSKVHFSTFILPVVFGAFLLNIPKYLELEFKIDENVTNSTTLDVQPTELRLNPTYIFLYTHVIRLVFTGIIPIMYLAVINVLIFKKIKDRERLPLEGQDVIERKGSKISAIALLAIVILFIACNSVRLFLDYFEWTIRLAIEEGQSPCNTTEMIKQVPSLISLSHFFLVLNSSANVLIYYSIHRVVKIKFSVFIEACVGMLPIPERQRSTELETFELAPLNV